MVLIPMVVTDSPPLKKNPVFLYYEDGFQKPNPFKADIAISIDDVWSKKIDAHEAEASQFYEAQPKCWGGGVEVPERCGGAKEVAGGPAAVYSFGRGSEGVGEVVWGWEGCAGEACGGVRVVRVRESAE